MEINVAAAKHARLTSCIYEPIARHNFTCDSFGCLALLGQKYVAVEND